MNNLEFSKICRLCMSSKGKMTYIFQSEELQVDDNSNLSLDVKIMLCSTVKVVRDDGLPSKACKQCLHLLDKWYKFKQKIESTNATLQILVQQQSQDYESQINNIQQVCDGTNTLQSSPSLHVNKSTRSRQHQEKECRPTASLPQDAGQMIETRLVKEAKYDSYYSDDGQDPSDEICFNDPEIEHKYAASSEMFDIDESTPIAPIKKRTQASRKPHHCETCNKTFSQSGDLHIHKRIHSGERPYICDACGKSFPSSSNLARHKRIHTGLRPFLCSLCTKSFAVRSALKEHENIHSGNKPFLCQECGKSFAQKGNLKIHEMLHTGVKPYSCNVCGKSFALRGNLKDHLNIHSCQKPHSCDVCLKSFTQRSTLKEHLKVHTGLKPFSCTACCKSFAYRKTLKIHLNTHTGEKRFNCEICQKGFSERSHLKRHMSIHSSLQKPTNSEALPV